MEKLTHRYCPLCESENIAAEIELRDHSITKEAFSIYRCTECEFLFTQNIPSEKHIGQYYESEDYISHSDTTSGVVNKLYHVVRNIMLNRKYQLIRQLNAGKELLDIGCGTGYFLNYMKSKNYDTLGIEMGEKARAYGQKKFGLGIRPPEDLTNGTVKGPFSIISLWHVLEHLYDPDQYLKTIHGLLKDEGFLIVALPNADCFDARHYKFYWAGYDVPRHLWHFTPKTMDRLAKKNHFEIVRLKKLPFDPFYNSILSEKYRNNKLGLIFGAAIGFISLLRSMFDVRKASSIIYVLKKST